MTVDRSSPGSRRAPTIRDVAQRAGVSKSLVSMVLRSEPGVSPERRTAVLQAVSQLGYEPNRLARALAGNGTGAVGILINDLRNPWYVELLDGISTAFEPAGVAPLIVDSATNQRVGRSSIQILMRQRVDAIIALGTSGEEAGLTTLSARTPVVLAGTYDPASIDADVVVGDDVAGARLATEHLIALGHRRIAYLRGPELVGELREQGYREAITDAGLVDMIVADEAGAMEESGYASARRVLEAIVRPTGIVAYNDLTAIGALSAAQDLGLSCPDDVSVVGYDDTYIAGIGRLSLSSVRNGTFDIGAMAATFALERIGGFDGTGRLHRVPSSVVARRTSGPAPL
ncbi:LacI family transcriptional regulator [Frondihabitans sp. PhB188]|uniref:LacI family DNA-binding transcriptional regulator n=1 Tax=Frondihabitans sp. PhB188 TaxID=2485200 RepID=UPI000F4667DE|nr:LacI family DNA-binding transcriptional regulator [Frondihabitans sp. PhB188]ROQ36552.1 LacI family transcriptional regulator [Frondihabitans sp. PhB188]